MLVAATLCNPGLGRTGTRIGHTTATLFTSEPRVHKGDRRLEDALVGAGQVDEHRDRRVHARSVLRVEVRLTCACRLGVIVCMQNCPHSGHAMHNSRRTLRSVADMALRQNIGRLLAAMVASACSDTDRCNSWICSIVPY